MSEISRLAGLSMVMGVLLLLFADSWQDLAIGAAFFLSPAIFAMVADYLTESSDDEGVGEA